MSHRVTIRLIKVTYRRRERKPYRDFMNLIITIWFTYLIKKEKERVHFKEDLRSLKGIHL